MPDENSTKDRILQAALDLFLQQGIRKTSIDDVAAGAGVTRVTVYRHFTDRAGLIGATFRQVNDALARVLESLSEEDELDAFRSRMATELASVPSGVIAGFAELETVDPGIHAELRSERTELLRAIFDRLYALAEREHRLRTGLDREVVEVLFWEVVMSLPESPALAALGYTTDEIYATVSSLLLDGLLER